MFWYVFQCKPTEQYVEHQCEHEVIHLTPGMNKGGLVLSISLLKFTCISNRETELNEPQYSKPGHRRVLSPQPSRFYFLIGLTSKHYGAQLFTISFKLNTGSPSKHLPRWAFSENKNWLPELSRRISDKAPHFLKCSETLCCKKNRNLLFRKVPL